MTSRRVRADRLLRLGSGEGNAEPRDGFEARVRRRIAALQAERDAEPDRPLWTDALGRVARPALAAAFLVTVASLAVQWWDRTRGDDLTLLAEGDEALSVLLAGELDEVEMLGEGAP